MVNFKNLRMKKIYAIAAGIFLLLFSFNAKAQTKTGADYFAGRWSMFIKGTPYGDLKRIYVLEKKDNSLTGLVLDTAGKEVARFTKVEIKENELTVYYHALGNDVNVTMIRKDEDHVTGSLLGMFDATGSRIK